MLINTIKRTYIFSDRKINYGANVEIYLNGERRVRDARRFGFLWKHIYREHFSF